MSWHQCHARCLNMAADMLTISSQEENDLVAAWAPYNIWLGLNDEAVEGTYVWESGDDDASTYRNWNTEWGQPEGGPDVNYVMMDIVW